MSKCISISHRTKWAPRREDFKSDLYILSDSSPSLISMFHQKIPTPYMGPLSYHMQGVHNPLTMTSL